MTKKDFLSRKMFFKAFIYKKTFFKLNIMLKHITVKMNKKLFQPMKFENVFNHNSFTGCVFEIFLMTLKTRNLPTLPSCQPGEIRNTSKYEFAFVIVLSQYHKKKFPNHSIQCYTEKDGKQFKIGKYSCDFFCKECKVGFFLEGTWKFICEKHPSDKTDNKTEKLHKLGIWKRKQFKILAKDVVGKIFVIPNCDISTGEYSSMFTKSTFFHSKLPNKVIEELKHYKREERVRLNYQNAMSIEYKYL